MYKSQSLVSNTVASLEHVRLIQSLASTDRINLVCNMSVEKFRCSIVESHLLNSESCINGFIYLNLYFGVS